MKSRKLICIVMSMVLCIAALGISSLFNKEWTEASAPAVDKIPGTDRTISDINESFLSVSGFAKGKINDRSHYKEGDREYAVAGDEKDFLTALREAMKGNVKVIEVRSDMYLGWWELSDEDKNAGRGVIDVYSGTESTAVTPVGNPVLIESGISTITLNNIDGLTIFSTNGATIKHTEIKLNSGCNDIAIRNLNFTETWEWDDWTRKGFGSTGGHGNAKRNGFTYLKINGAHNVWIDHCNFGIAFDGNVDVENGSNGVSITWCKFGDTDYSKGSMLYRAISYFEDIYQESKLNKDVSSFVMYGTARDNELTKEQIAVYMGYHKKCHLVGAGDKDTWLYKDSDGNIVKNELKTDANELLRISFGYNSYTGCGSRLPLLRGGVAHLYNCYIDDYNVSLANGYYNKKNSDGLTVKEQIEKAGGETHFLTWGSNPRCGAATAADTCDYYYVDAPLTYNEIDESMGQYSGWFGKNYGLIVNSRVKRNEKSSVYEGSSWDNNGENPFTESRVVWNSGKSTINNWLWGQEGKELPYSYQVFPLDYVKDYTNLYGGSGVLDYTASEWLKTEYAASGKIKLADTSEEIPVSKVNLNYENRTVYLGEYLQLYEKLEPYYTTETPEEFQWFSSDPSIASVNDCGLVKPLKEGKTTITLKTKSGKSASCKVTVEQLPTSLEVNNVPKTLYVGDSYTIEALVYPITADKGVTWSRLTTGIDIIDSDSGLVKVTDLGGRDSKTVQLVVSTTKRGNRIFDNTIKQRISIMAKKPEVPVTGIKTENKEIVLKKGGNLTVDAVVMPENATNKIIYYNIEDENIAVVDENGLVTAKAVGSTTMSAVTMNNGFEETYTIEVIDGELPIPTNNPGVTPDNYIMGDVDFNGKVDLADATKVLRAALLIDKLTSEEFKAADYDKSGNVDLQDAVLVLKKALGII